MGEFELASRLVVMYKQAHNDLMVEWNTLIGRINAKGGESFLNSDPVQLTQDEIKKLLQLCHPDKHDGKQLAVDMTQRLLELRKS